MYVRHLLVQLSISSRCYGRSAPEVPLPTESIAGSRRWVEGEVSGTRRLIELGSTGTSGRNEVTMAVTRVRSGVGVAGPCRRSKVTMTETRRQSIVGMVIPRPWSDASEASVCRDR